MPSKKTSQANVQKAREKMKKIVSLGKKALKNSVILEAEPEVKTKEEQSELETTCFESDTEYSDSTSESEYSEEEEEVKDVVKPLPQVPKSEPIPIPARKPRKKKVSSREKQRQQEEFLKKLLEEQLNSQLETQFNNLEKKLKISVARNKTRGAIDKCTLLMD